MLTPHLSRRSCRLSASECWIHHIDLERQQRILSDETGGKSKITWSLVYWLVVWTPLKNISQLGWLFPIYGKIKLMFQTTNQFSILQDHKSWRSWGEPYQDEHHQPKMTVMIIQICRWYPHRWYCHCLHLKMFLGRWRGKENRPVQKTVVWFYKYQMPRWEYDYLKTLCTVVQNFRTSLAPPVCTYLWNTYLFTPNLWSWFQTNLRDSGQTLDTDPRGPKKVAFHTISGWWLCHPSEKYESIGMISNPILMGK